MAKMGITKEKVVALAAEIADTNGYDTLPLKEIAEPYWKLVGGRRYHTTATAF